MKGLLGTSLNKKTLLFKTLEKFHSQNLQPKIGIEMEFYLQEKNNPPSHKQVKKFIFDLKTAIFDNNIGIVRIEPEQGSGQIEIKTPPYLDIPKLCQDIEQIKDIICNLSADLRVNFSAQPFLKDCGSSLQINFSLTKNNKLIFAKNEGVESECLLHCVSGILGNIKNMMIIFAPLKQDYQRLDMQINRSLHKERKFTAPTNISWGYDNRTTLIRIPKTNKDNDRRLEFRLASNSSDIYLAISFLLLAILEGLSKKSKAPQEIYGNSFDGQYELEVLPNYEEAKGYFSKAGFNKKYLMPRPEH
ncbi:MAG: glutamine synthetase [Rickettsiales bacterium]|jgi:glutamine synthetase